MEDFEDYTSAWTQPEVHGSKHEWVVFCLLNDVIINILWVVFVERKPLSSYHNEFEVHHIWTYKTRIILFPHLVSYDDRLIPRPSKQDPTTFLQFWNFSKNRKITKRLQSIDHRTPTKKKKNVEIFENRRDNVSSSSDGSSHRNVRDERVQIFKSEKKMNEEKRREKKKRRKIRRNEGESEIKRQNGGVKKWNTD